MGDMEMQPIEITEMPLEIKEYLHTINAIKFPRQGYSSDVAIIESDQGVFALKRTKGKLFCSWLEREVTVLNCLAKQTTLPVPTVKKFVEQQNQNNHWALLECVEGETLRTALSTETNKGKRQEMLFHFGAILSQIHATPCPKELQYEQKWLDHMLDQAEYNFKNYKVDGNQPLLEKIKRTQPDDYQQTLIHGDFTIDNVLVSNGVITGVIDWGSGTYGDPRYDVSLAIRPKPNAFENNIDKEIFFEGYGSKIIDDNIYNYFVNGLYEFF